MTTAILATAFTVGLITGGGLLLFFRRARAGGGSLPVKAAVVEHSPVGTLILDPNLSVTFANEAFCHFFTLAADQVVGRGIQDILDTRLKAVVEQPDIFESSLLAAYAPEAPTSSLEIHVFSEGPREQLWLDHTSHEISEGPLAGYRVAYFVDITPAKSLIVGQEARAERQEEFEMALVGASLVTSLGRVEDSSLVTEIRKAVRGGGPQRLRRQIERSGPWLDIFINPSPMGVGITIQNRAMRRTHETAQDLLFETEGWNEADSRLATRRNQARMRYEAPLVDRNGKVHPVRRGRSQGLLRASP